MIPSIRRELLRLHRDFCRSGTDNLTKQQRRLLSHFRVVEHTVRCQHIRDRPGAVEPGHNLRLSVKQYIPKSNDKPRPGDVTLIGAHANGFPKELYEPLWDDLHENFKKSGRNIRAIWIADVAQQGQSGILNEKILGNDTSWWDHSRDLLYLINQYQDQMPGPLIGIGHSMGASQLAYLSLLHPSLFQALVLIEPVIQRENPGKVYALASTYRRDTWPSRQEAADKFRSTKFFQQWDSRVLDKWIDFGLRDLPTETHPKPVQDGKLPVTLTTTKAQEVFSYLRPAYPNNTWPEDGASMFREMYSEDQEDYPFYRPEPAHLFRRLPDIKPDVLYIFGDQSELSSSQSRQKKMDITGINPGGSGGSVKGHVQEAVLTCGHLVPMERVIECAEASAGFIENQLSLWQTRTESFQKQWDEIPRQDRGKIDDQWKQNIGGPPSRSK